MNIIVVGVTGGVGGKIAAQFALAGAKQTLIGRNPERLAKLRLEFAGTHSQFLMADATNPAHVENFFDKALEYGRIDAVVVAAGSHKSVSLDTPVDEALAILQKHNQQFGEVTLVVGMTAAKVFREQNHGLLIYISSHVTSDSELHSNITYRGAKKEAESILDDLRGELKGTKVRITTIAPSTVNTPGMAEYLDTDEKRQSAVQPEEIAEEILTLLSKEDVPPMIIMKKEFKF